MGEMEGKERAEKESDKYSVRRLKAGIHGEDKGE